jgi:hypothetical protein
LCRVIGLPESTYRYQSQRSEPEGLRNDASALGRAVDQAVVGSVENTFQLGEIFDVNYGDLDVCPATGSLLVVSSSEIRIAEITPSGSLVNTTIFPLASPA